MRGRHLFVTLLVLTLAWVAVSIAVIPGQISFQGKLTRQNGGPVADANYQLIFRIYNAPISGDLIWEEPDTLTTKAGLFQMMLGTVNPIPQNIFSDTSTYLAIVFDGIELEPRKPFRSVGYAYHAAVADSAPMPDSVLHAIWADTAEYARHAAVADIALMTDSDWAIDGDNIYHLNGNVGIGTDAPSSRFHVAGNTRVEGSLNIATNSSSEINGDDGQVLNINSPYGVALQTTTDSASILFLTNAQDRMIIGGTGNVGIGTTTPAQKLDINGDIRTSTGQIRSPNEIHLLTDASAAQTLKAGALAIASSYSNDPPANGLYVQGNVGIGTTSPAEKLHVNGSIRGNQASGALRISTASGYIDIGPQNSTWAHINTDRENFYFGSGLHVNGGMIGSYTGDNLSLHTGGTIRMTADVATGNVGIGTTTPSYKLHVNGSISGTTLNTGAGNNELYAMNQDVTTTDNPTFNRVHLADYGTALGGLHIGGTSDPGTDNLIVDGSIGVGTSTPDSRIAVSAGDIGAASFRNNSTGSVGVWIYNSSGMALSCGTGSTGSGVAPFQAISYNNEASRLAILCNGSMNATGTVTANSYWNGRNAVTGSSTSDYAGVAGINTGSGNGIYGTATSGYAGYFAGNVWITGSIHKGSGTFTIDHPLEPDTKYLNHSFVESPDMMNVYNGNTILDDRGEAFVELPSYFEALNKDFRYQLTCIGGHADVFIAEEVVGNRFKIGGGDPGLKVSWQVTGVRRDAYANAHRVIPEVEKSAADRGKYLHPIELGKSQALQIGHIELERAEAGR